MTAEAVASLLGALEQRLGAITLVMLVSDTGGDETWQLLVSAPALDAMEPSEGVNTLTPIVMEAMAEDDWRSIYQVVVLRTGHPLVKTLHAFGVPQPFVQEIFGVTLASTIIPRAWVVASPRQGRNR
jgi:hypothetical protein